MWSCASSLCFCLLCGAGCQDPTVQLRSSEPMDHARDISVLDPLILKFSSPVFADRAVVQWNHPAQPGLVPSRISVDDRTVVVQPIEPLPYGLRHEVEVRGLTTEDGVELPAVNVSFRTLANPVERISLGRSGEEVVSMACDVNDLGHLGVCTITSGPAGTVQRIHSYSGDVLVEVLDISLESEAVVRQVTHITNEREQITRTLTRESDTERVTVHTYEDGQLVGSRTEEEGFLLQESTFLVGRRGAELGVQHRYYSPDEGFSFASGDKRIVDNLGRLLRLTELVDAGNGSLAPHRTIQYDVDPQGRRIQEMRSDQFGLVDYVLMTRDSQGLIEERRHYSAGNDRELNTRDDELIGVETTTYDVRGQRIESVSLTNPGSDNEWFTSDDLYARIEYAP